MNRLVTFQRWLLTLDHHTPPSPSQLDTSAVDNAFSTSHYRSYYYMPQVTNYMFCFGGTLRTNRAMGTKFLSLFVLFLIIVPCVLFSIFEASYSVYNGALKTLVILFYIFWLHTIVSFIAAATMDPGILPKRIHSPFDQRDPAVFNNNRNNNINLPQEYYNIITLPCQNNQNMRSTVDIKYCKTCQIWRPPRSYHCPTCQCCISLHDHHCIWVNNCIGQRNYRFFISFLLDCVITDIILIICSSIHIYRERNTHLPPVSVLLIIFSGLTIWYPLLLFVYHLLMTSTQQTTREYLKNLNGIKNPIMHPRVKRRHDNNYDFGNRFNNSWQLMAQVRGPNLWSPRSHINSNDIRVQR